MIDEIRKLKPSKSNISGYLNGYKSVINEVVENVLITVDKMTKGRSLYTESLSVSLYSNPECFRKKSEVRKNYNSYLLF